MAIIPITVWNPPTNITTMDCCKNFCRVCWINNFTKSSFPSSQRYRCWSCCTNLVAWNLSQSSTHKLIHDVLHTQIQQQTSPQTCWMKSFTELHTQIQQQTSPQTCWMKSFTEFHTQTHPWRTPHACAGAYFTHKSNNKLHHKPSQQSSHEPCE